MEKQSPLGVLICGAGATGLTLAIDLARRGVPFRLIEKLDSPFPGSRGRGIQPRTQEVFEDLGIIDRIVAVGGLYAPQRDYREDGSYAESDMGEWRDATPAEPYHLALMVPQFLTERVMRERLAELGHQVAFGCELVGFAQDEDGVTARLAGPAGEETVRARYLVGADGGRSFVRGALGVDFPGQTLGMRAVAADVTLTGLGRDAWHRFNGANMERQVAISPLAGTDLFAIQGPIPQEGEVDLSAEGLERMIAERTGRSDIHIQSVSWASAYTMNARLANRYRVGRVFLAGDAAHIHPPTGGQGLNTSVQDAYNLGWKLAAVLGGAPQRLLDSYEEERRPVAEAMLGLSTGLLEAMKRGVNRRSREVQQLDLRYAHSSLALATSGETSRPSGALCAGDRAPDAPLRGAGGHARRLFELFAGPHWTLVGFEPERDILPPRPGLRIHKVGVGRELADEAGHLRKAYGLAPGAWVLVRPDGYVAAIVASEDADALDRYLRDVGLEPTGFVLSPAAERELVPSRDRG
ncbi:FAD-dependent oxidoreductase [Chondromyces apiculatus]|uniref:Putative flavodoxin monooxygenase n=1 Tax=Chondromyces apiculatus DSM 436 TaxID=1192034 RepID=A0A017TIU7_9BACT|nr:FAD-dependent oxidoreductase [Chondromyces apiculatus]EYF08526.1 putative flavodoxin monooxygenase [Chondromyces apiculatus DSM 436]